MSQDTYRMPVEYIKRGYRKVYENGELILKEVAQPEETPDELVEPGDE